MSTFSERILAIADSNRQKLQDFYQYFHRHPELSMKEYQTSDHIAAILMELGIELIETGLDTGVAGILRGGQDGPCIALRADIDALPIQEQSSCPFPSENEGVMHACGHDTHITSLLGAALILSEMRDDIRGTVKFIFQPAEEKNLGATAMIHSGVLEDPRVEACFSLHGTAEIPTGSVAVIPGPIMAGLNTIDIEITGKGGHGGIPHRSTDPVVAAAAIIQSLQTIVSRNVAPTDSAVVSICSVHTSNGIISNVIPDNVHMKGTVRFYSEEDKAMINRRILEIVEGIASAYNCTASFEISDDLPVTTNAPFHGQRDLSAIAYRTVADIGAAAVSPAPSGGGDDFSYYSIGIEGKAGVPSFFYWLGVRNEDLDCIYSWHSPKFRTDPAALPIGAALLAMSAINAADDILSDP